MRPEGYGRAAGLLHWIMAVAVFFLFLSAWWMLTLPFGALRSLPFSLHKSLGITVLALLLAFLALRLWRRPAAAHGAGARGWLRGLALLDHLLLYGLLIGVCVSGYLSSAYSGWTTTLWWWLALPDWADKNVELNRLFSDLHAWFAWGLLGVVGLHVGGAVYHVMRGDGGGRRMLRL